MRRLMAILAGSVLLIAGCGGDSGPDPAEDPKGALVSAFRALGDSGMTLTVRLNAGVDDLIALAQGSGDALPEEDAQKILDSSLRITTNGESDPENSQTEIAVNVAGLENAIEMKFRDDTLYARASVRELVEEFGGSAAEIDQAVAGAPPGFEFIGPAIEGEWIGLTGFQALADQLGAMAGQPPAEEQQEEAEKMAEAMAQLLQDNANVTHEGSDDAGDHMVVTMNLRDTYTGFVQILGTFGSLGGAQMGQLPPESEIPDRDVVFDTWVDGGRVTQVEFDITQFSDLPEAEIPADVENFGILVEFEEFDGEIEAPEDFNEVDLQQLMQAFLGGLGGMTETETSAPTTEMPDDFCEQLAEAPPEVIAQFEAECPELQQ